MTVTLSDAEARALVMGRFVRIELGRWVPLTEGLFAKSAFVGRIRGRLHAYYNVCRHHPVELDLIPEDPPELLASDAACEARVRRAPMADDGVHLMCCSHGALYRPTDGECILGPCFGQSLIALVVREEGGQITLFPEVLPT